MIKEKVGALSESYYWVPIKGTNMALGEPGSHNIIDLKKKTKDRAYILRFIFAFIAIFCVGAPLVIQATSSVMVAYADESDDTDKIKKVLDEAKGEFGAGSGDDSFFEDLNKASQETESNSTSFGYLIRRLFTVGYINETPNAPNIGEGSGKARQCEVNSQGAGTVVYHNCDIPNLVTEFWQNTLNVFMSTGIVSGESETAKIDSEWFGLPSGLPGDGAVPVNPSDRTVKYTGLELFGYNFKLTLYRGEYDHIQTNSQARALANYGAMDGLVLSAHTIVNGATGAMSQAAENAGNAISKGDFFGAIGGATQGLFSGGVASSVNTILDASDENIVRMHGWSRGLYGQTIYGARELTKKEIGERQISLLTDAIKEKRGIEEYVVPNDVLSLETPPSKPKDDVSLCEIKNENGDFEKFGNSTDSPGVTKEECSSEAGSAEFKWSATGSQKKETLSEWKKANEAWFSKAASNGLKCEIDTSSEDNREQKVSDFYSCIPNAYADMVRTLTNKGNSEAIEKWVGEAVSDKFLSDYLKKNPGKNPEAPWNRYVCLNEDGSEMVTANNAYVFVYNQDGSLTGNCNPMRPPIQGALFGDGYVGDHNPGIDTRRARLEDPLMYMFFPTDVMINWASNLSLGVSSFLTRVSNTALNLSFAPMLKTMGLDTLIIGLVDDFRESIFAPIVVLTVAAGAVYVTIMFVFGKGVGHIRQLLMMAITATLGFALLFNPSGVVKMIDQVPASIEGAIIESVYGATVEDGSDPVCMATGASKDIYEAASLRNIMCQNWKTFTFNQYVAQQWGTSYNHLYANGSGKGSEFELQNQNGNLVGTADVVMGGGVTEKNWALYQLDSTLTGTTTTASYSDPTSTLGSSNMMGIVNPNLYKVVDAQAGPNGGEGRDSRFFQSWSGVDTGTRLGYGIIGSISSATGAVAVISYSIGKIIVTALSTVLYLAAPFMFAVCIFPRFTRYLKSYVLSIVGLMVQRIMLVVVMALMLRVLLNIADSSTNFFLNALLGIVVSVIFILAKRKFLDKTLLAITPGKAWGQVSSNREFWSTVSKNTPRSIKSPINVASQGAMGYASGFAGAFATGGGAKNASKYALDQAKFKARRAENVQRRGTGFTVGQTAFKTAKNVESSIKKDIGNHSQYDYLAGKTSEKMRETLNTNEGLSNSLQKTNENLKARASDPKDLGVIGRTSQSIMFGGKDTGPITPSDYRRISKMEKALDKVSESDKKLKSQTLGYSYRTSDIGELSNRQDRISEFKTTSAFDKASSNLEKIIEREAQREAVRAIRKDTVKAYQEDIKRLMGK